MKKVLQVLVAISVCNNKDWNEDYDINFFYSSSLFVSSFKSSNVIAVIFFPSRSIL